jgi:transposase
MIVEKCRSRNGVGALLRGLPEVRSSSVFSLKLLRSERLEEGKIGEMIDEEVWMDINALRRQGYTYAQIGRMVGRDWRTVKRYLTEGAQPLYRREKDAPSMLDPFKDVVDGWLRREPNLRATRVHQDLVRDYGFSGGYQIVQRYVRDQKAVRDDRFGYEERFETAPGHQAQVDWSHEEPILTPEGLALPLYCFHMVLSHSRDAFCSMVGSMDLSTFWGCHRAAFSHFGGVPKEILYDRTKTVVRQHVGREQGLLERRLFHPEALASAMHYGFRMRLCKPYRAKTKGKVESDVDYVRGRLLRAHSFRSYEEANASWREWNEDVARKRVHGTHGEIVRERAERDRAALLALPPDPYLVVSRTQRTVARDGFFSFEGRRYAVPASSAAKPGERVELVLGAREVEVRSSRTGRLLASYERGRPGRILPDPSTERGSVALAEVLGALPSEAADVHSRPLSIYEEVVASG